MGHGWARTAASTLSASSQILHAHSLPHSWASFPFPPSLRGPYWWISFSIRLSSHDWKSVSFMPSALMSSSSCDPCSSDSVASPSGEESCSTWAMYFCRGGRGESRNTREPEGLLVAAEHNPQSTVRKAEHGDTLGGQGSVQTPWDVLRERVKARLAWPCNSAHAKSQHPGTGSTSRSQARDTTRLFSSLEPMWTGRLYLPPIGNLLLETCHHH